MRIKGDISLHSVMQKLSSALYVLSHFRWASPYGSHISVASILGTVGLLLAIRDGRIGSLSSLLSLGDGNASSKKKFYAPGLRNLGNNCYLNVVLQSLASCLSFRKYLDEVQDFLSSSAVGQVHDLPLLDSLGTLIEDLSTIQERRVTLNPQNVMLAMHEHMPDFQLTNQQDAAEAFLHLLSCLRDELSESYMPRCSSLADVNASTGRVLSIRRKNSVNDPERWRKLYLGPFDGILSSSLSCRSCSSEILMDFDFFHTLPLQLLVRTTSISMLHSITLEQCLESYLAPERVENYYCSRCWHTVAYKYLSAVGGQEEEISKLSCCSEQDSCDCRNLSSLEALPWSNRLSHTFKQFQIAYAPQVLCVHLQRTSMNCFGELVKLQGHVSFPLILNLSPFMKHKVDFQKQEATCSPEPSRNHFYRLVSVVEHFGKAGSGHYIVYRCLRADVETCDSGGSNTLSIEWFRISDTEVQHAPQEEVLGAEASLLFYERI